MILPIPTFDGVLGKIVIFLTELEEFVALCAANLSNMIFFWQKKGMSVF